MNNVVDKISEEKKTSTIVFRPSLKEFILAEYDSPSKSYLKICKYSWGNYYRLNWWGPKVVSGREQTCVVQSVFCKITPTEDSFKIEEK